MPGVEKKNPDETSKFDKFTQDIKDKMKDLDSDKIIAKIMGNSHMVFKTGNIKSLNFIERPEIFYLTKDSQPFIGDLNGDMIDDILFNNQDDSAATKSGRLNIATFNSKTNSYDIANFRETMIDKSCGG